MAKKMLIESINELIKCMQFMVREKNCNVFKIFDGTPQVVYGYASHSDPDAPYIVKHIYDLNVSKEDFTTIKNELLCKIQEIRGIKIAILAKKSNGIRIRFSDENESVDDKVFRLSTLLECTLPDPVKSDTLSKPKKSCSKTVVKNERKKMEDFSLSNLKDAFIQKVTRLDRKTVMILAIVALILLVVGKYTTIKEIAVGIKDKIKRSKNFKAMMEDGTNAVNSLKKIVGVKSGDKDEA